MFPPLFNDCFKLLAAAPKYRGAVAQLGERYNGIVEVRSSILLGSTIFSYLFQYVKARRSK